ncbi:MAG: ABC transporter ATP-binding protein [Deltaproteobacteria bacterium]|jgi:ABC-2 type transport system ATP-binding protein|nr:ABC transporter ATP-binding protein [Deltaproteobacteria bacterium]
MMSKKNKPQPGSEKKTQSGGPAGSETSAAGSGVAGSGEAGSGADPIISVRNLDVYFGSQRALKDVSLDIPEGARVALLGPNGAGKSTLIKALCGAVDPGGGAVSIAGMSPGEARAEPLLLGWLPEGAPLNPELTVLEHLAMAARLRGLDGKAARAEIERLGDALSLGTKFKRLAGGLSMGSRRQAAAALALLGRPRIVVLDEPTSSLDPAEARRLTALLKKLAPETTLVVSSHILPEVASLTDSAVFLQDGELTARGTWSELAGAGGSPDQVYFQLVRQ